MQRKFTTRVDAKLLSSLRKLARQEGRTLQGLVEEALVELIRKRGGKPRPSGMRVYHSSIERFGPLYKRLAD